MIKEKHAMRRRERGSEGSPPTQRGYSRRQRAIRHTQATATEAGDAVSVQRDAGGYPPPNWKVEQLSRNVVNVRIEDLSRASELRFLLRSDAHHDNPKCDRKMEKRHLDYAMEVGAGIIDAGDLFCAMQGKFDKRADKSAVRPEHQHGDYLDKLVSTAADFYTPYAKNWIVMGLGNHETAIRKRCETDLTERLVQAIKTRVPNSPLTAGGYGGWVRFMMARKGGGNRNTITMHYFHGTGGGGPVTRGVIQTNRLAVFNPDAHIVFTGHTHDAWELPITRQRINEQGRLYHDRQLHVRVGGYKDAWADGHSGWEVEKMLGPKPNGAAMLTIKHSNEIGRSVCKVEELQ